MKYFSALLAALLAAASFGAAAQSADSAPPAPCPASLLELPIAALYGAWEAQIDGTPGLAAVQLQAHPDYEGLRGTIERAGRPPAQLAGDIDDQGQLNLDESQDGQSISGTWTGALQHGSCGRQLQGTWLDASDESTHPFVLRRVGNW